MTADIPAFRRALRELCKLYRVCNSCMGRPAKPKRVKCQRCLDRQSQYSLKWYYRTKGQPNEDDHNPES
jgi:hypothetical protein